jgi:hypothetical protein
MSTFVLRFSLIIAMTLLFSGCSQDSKSSETKDNALFFDSMMLGAFNSKNNLTIEAGFTECAEWGGHHEKIVLYANKEQVFYANYKVYPFKCDSLENYYRNKNLTPRIDKTIKLNDVKKKAVIDYIKRLIESKIAEGLPQSNANNIFTIANSDSTLFIEVFGDKEREIKSYNKFVSDLLQ